MILSFHPCVVTDENRICAGRQPDHQDLAAIRRASAVILPQGCPESLYRMARENCVHLFPHHETRFAYPGKIGQIHLFNSHGVRIPPSRCFPDLATYIRQHPDPARPPLGFPLVLKLNWGGEGDTVYPIADHQALKEIFGMVAAQEATGQAAFILQSRIDTQPRGGALRVAVIGRRLTAYWRISGKENPFHSSLSRGARIDDQLRPDLQRKGIAATEKFCLQSGINLAGFDLIFSRQELDPEPLFLEINYFFGRRGLGGSQQFYQYLNQEVSAWLAEHNLQ
ncbi:MAG: hypothetical protein WBG37_19985 [Desulfobacterales bacterium]